MSPSQQSPITHRQAIAAIPADTLERLRRTRDGPGVRHLALHLALLALTSVCILMATSWWLLGPALLAQGILLSFLFTLEHECIHGTAFRSPWINTVAAEASGAILLLPPRYFRYFHFAHHRHTQDPGNDPELATPRPGTWTQYLLALTGWGYWKGMVAALLRNGLGRRRDDFVPPKAWPRLVREARLYLLFYAGLAGLGVAGGWSLLVWLWVLPMLLGQPFLRAYLMAEHTGLPLVPDMLLNSRTVFAAPLINWLAWNMPNHTAHHVVPTVPFHNLPALTALLRQDLRSTSRSYAAVHAEVQAGLKP